MSFLEDNIDNCKIGFAGEDTVRNWFIKNKVKFMQLDIMFYHKGKWCLGEVKTQEKYLAPPFDGHGLPQWQIDRRMQFYKDTGVKPYFIVKCLDDECLYIKDMPTLLEGKSFKTKGKKPRVIFPVSSFEKRSL